MRTGSCSQALPTTHQHVSALVNWFFFREAQALPRRRLSAGGDTFKTHEIHCPWFGKEFQLVPGSETPLRVNQHIQHPLKPHRGARMHQQPRGPGLEATQTRCYKSKKCPQTLSNSHFKIQLNPSLNGNTEMKRVPGFHILHARSGKWLR